MPERLQLAQAECRRIARGHYENFVVGSLFLPRSIRQDFYNVYAFCRTADDLADESGSPKIALKRLNALQIDLQECFDENGTPEGILLALRDTITRHTLPSQPFFDLLDAFQQDQRVSEYMTFDSLLNYCQRSANPVGRIVLRLAGLDSPKLDQLSDSICTGLQLANFWQDVRRDLAIGRIYIPLEDRNRFGVTEADLSEPTASAKVRELIAYEVARTETFFAQGMPLAQQVPRWLARDIRLFAHGGLATLHAIGKQNYDVLRRRPKVSRWRQAQLACAALGGRLS
ncbi:All-trans-phytoene synthase [Roseimaritima multifibrata]|uniref:All-trans-phytoene synthase n=1 Tax=Roseimaritima multifibrata TaxID=1930274 RepID=A0A517MMP5_9BACT|nr:squalene synthase HpnC [Roseimaritima multifibrata]QDS96140.1 All-trans-phytoene synthase [Roseimaritima multifibrata]